MELQRLSSQARDRDRSTAEKVDLIPLIVVDLLALLLCQCRDPVKIVN